MALTRDDLLCFFSVSFLCSNVKFMTFVYSVSALEVLLVYTALYKLSFIIIIIIIIIIITQSQFNPLRLNQVVKNTELDLERY